MKNDQLKMGIILSYISMALGYAISIIYTPIMLRLLGQTEYGLYTLVGSLVAVLDVLNFGFGSTYVRFYLRYTSSNENDKVPILNGMFLSIFTLISILTLIIGFFIYLNVDHILGNSLTNNQFDKAKILLMILIFNLAISFINIIFTSYITANEKFIYQKIINMIKSILTPIVIVIILFNNHGSLGMVLVTIIINMIFEIINIYFCIKKIDMKFSFVKFDKFLLREIIVFSSFIFINLVVEQINWNIDKLILGYFKGVDSVAIYGLAAQLNAYFIAISVTISSVFIPRVHKIVSKTSNDIELNSLFIKIGRIQFLILSLVSTGIIFFGRPFINLWAGNDYDQSYFVLLLLVIPFTLSPGIQNIGIEIQRAKNKHKFRSLLYIAIAIFNILISISLSKKYGPIGSAIGTAIALIIGSGLIMNWYYYKKIGLDIELFWKQITSILPALILPIILGILLNNFFDLYNFFTFFISGVLYVVLFIFSVWKFGLNEFEKNLFLKPLIRLLNKFRINECEG